MPVALIRKLDSLIGLAELEKAAIQRAFQQSQMFGPSCDLFREDDFMRGVTIMLSGMAYRYKTLANGKRQIIGFVLPGDLVSGGMLSAERFDHSLHLVTPCAVATIQKPQTCGVDPALARALWSLAARELSITWEWVVNIGQRQARARLAHLFCEFYCRMAEIGQANDGCVIFPVTQQEVADSIGLTNVHVNRILQGLRQERLVAFECRSLRILDLPALRQIGMFNPNYLHLESQAQRARPAAMLARS